MKLRFLLIGITLNALIFVGIVQLFPMKIYPKQAQAVVGELTISGASGDFTGDITGGRFVDKANSAYFIDPAASGTSLYTVGAATISGQFTAANTFTFKSVSATELGLYDSTNTLLVSFDEGN